jgi:fatty acid desaturase
MRAARMVATIRVSPSVQEQFEHRQLLSKAELRALLEKQKRASALRLALHLGTLAILAWSIMYWHAAPFVALPASVTLALAWAAVFAPFNECTHRTAFATPPYNALGAWLTGFAFGMAPGVYRTFHFEHRRPHAECRQQRLRTLLAVEHELSRRAPRLTGHSLVPAAGRPLHAGPAPAGIRAGLPRAARERARQAADRDTSALSVVDARA